MKTAYNISYPQARQQWFSVGIFPPKQLFGLTGNRPQSAPACSFLRYGQPKKTTTMTDNNINIDNINEVTDKVYVQLIDGATAWVPTNAHKLGDNEYLILPDQEFKENDPINLYEFIPGDIVALDQQTFQDGTTGLVCRQLIKPSNRPDKKYFDFLFKATLGQLEINIMIRDNFKSEIEKIKRQHSAGQYFYPAILTTIDQIDKCTK
jgi:hypothetical protein